MLHRCVLALLLVSFWMPAAASQITVSAAASLADALKEIASNYEAHANDKVFCNFAASSTLARQIQEGAPVDIFFSADEAKMDALEKNGLIAVGSRRSLLSNSLVVIVPNDSRLAVRSAADLTNTTISRVALADTRLVPAGIYAKEYLLNQKLWPAIAPKVIPTENVRGALAAVESGNVDAGLVYKTDAAISKRVKIAYEVSRSDGPKISYPIALVKDAPQSEAARRFLKYLCSDAAAKVFEKYGFIVLK